MRRRGGIGGGRGGGGAHCAPVHQRANVAPSVRGSGDASPFGRVKPDVSVKVGQGTVTGDGGRRVLKRRVLVDLISCCFFSRLFVPLLLSHLFIRAWRQVQSQFWTSSLPLCLSRAFLVLFPIEDNGRIDSIGTADL